MQEREILLRLIYRAFLDIRMASREGNARVGERLSDLLHNLPLMMIKGDDDGRVFAELEKRAEMFGLSKWLQIAMEDISKNEGL